MLPETVASNTQVRSPKCEGAGTRQLLGNNSSLGKNGKTETCWYQTFSFLPQGCNGSFEGMRQELSVIQKVSSKLQFVSLSESG